MYEEIREEIERREHKKLAHELKLDVLLQDKGLTREDVRKAIRGEELTIRAYTPTEEEAEEALELYKKQQKGKIGSSEDAVGLILLKVVELSKAQERLAQMRSLLYGDEATL